MKSLLALLATLLMFEKSMAETVTIFTNSRISISEYSRKVTFSGEYNSHSPAEGDALVLRLNKSSFNPPEYNNVFSITLADTAFNDMFRRRPLEIGEHLTVIARCNGPYNLVSYLDSVNGPSMYNYTCQIASMTVELRQDAARAPVQPATRKPAGAVSVQIEKSKSFPLKGGLAQQ